MIPEVQPSRRAAALAAPAAKGVDRVLISPRRLRRRVRELAEQLSADYAGGEVICVGALNGVVCFLADLIRELDIPAPVELVHVDRYVEEGEHTVDMPNPFRESLRGRKILIIEDIVDTGVTLKMLVEKVLAESPASLKVCTLLDKPLTARLRSNSTTSASRYRPYSLSDTAFDYEGFYRNLPFVGVVDSAVWPPALLERPRRIRVGRASASLTRGARIGHTRGTNRNTCVVSALKGVENDHGHSLQRRHGRGP